MLKNPRFLKVAVPVWNALIIVGEIVAAGALVGMLVVTGCAPVEPDPRGGIHTTCGPGPDGGAIATGTCGPGQYAYCLEPEDGGSPASVFAICCDMGVSLDECERIARAAAPRDR